MSLRGYCRTLMFFIACKPAMRITKLTTKANTGRFMKRSVNDFIWVAHAPSRAHFGALAEMRDECPETGLVEYGFRRGRRKQHARARALPRNQQTLSLLRHADVDIQSYVSAGFGFSSSVGARSLLIVTVIPFRNLKTPVLTTVSPAFKPVVTEIKSPRVSPMRTNCWRIVSASSPVFGSFFFSIT